MQNLKNVTAAINFFQSKYSPQRAWHIPRTWTLPIV